MGSSKGQGQAVCALPHMSHTSGPAGFIMLLDTYSENGFSFSFRLFFFTSDQKLQSRFLLPPLERSSSLISGTQ